MNTGVLARAGACNLNSHLYDKDVVYRECSDYFDTHVRFNQALGEFEHPDPEGLGGFRALNIDHISHHVIDYWWRGNILVGYVEILPTPKGFQLRDQYLAGYLLGMSTRGLGSFQEKGGIRYVGADYKLITFDFVRAPATEGAYMRPVQGTFPQMRKPIDVHQQLRLFTKYS